MYIHVGVWRTATVHSLKQQWAQELGNYVGELCPVKYSIQYVHVRTTWCKKKDEELTSLCQYI